MANYKETIQVHAEDTVAALYAQCIEVAATHAISHNYLRRLLGVSSATMWKWRKTGEAPRSLDVAMRMQAFLAEPAKYRR